MENPKLAAVSKIPTARSFGLNPRNIFELPFLARLIPPCPASLLVFAPFFKSSLTISSTKMKIQIRHDQLQPDLPPARRGSN
jgi:hypothetical protein